MEIKIYNDIVFKWIFGRQSYTAPLIALLNAITLPAKKFSEVTILNPFDESEPFKNEKQGILDIRAKDDLSGEWINLEVQVNPGFHYPPRCKFYLAGMYRDQLEKGKDALYSDLKACYGIHILVGTLFDKPEEENFWFNHYAMLNTRTHKPLVNHWHLYYIELEKYLRSLEKKAEARPRNELEEWALFIGTIQDNDRPLDERINHNPMIREVYKMIETFTKDDHLREKYRVQEEFIRVQKTNEYMTEKMRQEIVRLGHEVEHFMAEQERITAENKAALLAQERERAEKERERTEKEAALLAQERERAEKERERAEKEAFKKNSILQLRKKGFSDADIISTLGVSDEDIRNLD